MGVDLLGDRVPVSTSLTSMLGGRMKEEDREGGGSQCASRTMHRGSDEWHKSVSNGLLCVTACSKSLQSSVGQPYFLCLHAGSTAQCSARGKFRGLAGDAPTKSSLMTRWKECGEDLAWKRRPFLAVVVFCCRWRREIQNGDREDFSHVLELPAAA